MNINHSKNLLKMLASLVGVASTGALISLPVYALPQSSSRNLETNQAPIGNRLYSQAGQSGDTTGTQQYPNNGTSGTNNGTTGGTQQYPNNGTSGTNNGTTGGTQQYANKALPENKMPSRINNIFGTTDISRRFRPQGESDGWAFYLLDLPNGTTGGTQQYPNNGTSGTNNGTTGGTQQYPNNGTSGTNNGTTGGTQQYPNNGTSGTNNGTTGTQQNQNTGGNNTTGGQNTGGGVRALW